ncbi:PAS-domain containing protein [Sinisalibacter aestuarii]|uniref:Diguanylate cyclase n=1 Tax=Sinisalibacter aestuarii TaxID=2949426 RepID=A0ABQ5LPZ2_9RHOB|nr:PAS-domain containing protein [Sinisalibacter aestuarii]GKY86485.1 diguanylate cyclase [Sinisalibacter aestuarii]
MPATLAAVSMIVVAFSVAYAALTAFALLDRRRTSQLRRFSDAERDAIVFIFENETLLAATPAARRLLEAAPRHGAVWTHLAELLGPRFPRLTDRIKDLAELGQIDLVSADGASRLRAEWHDGVARLTLEPADGGDTAARIDSQSYMIMSQELDSLRALAEYTPLPLWRETASGTITWCNAAYLDLTESAAAGAEAQGWPPAPLFALTDETLIEGESGLHRVALAPAQEERRRWFDVTLHTLPGGDRFGTAISSDRLVKAESALKEFVSTLTKTFAALPIGLAIFDRSRELALFNPALMDLTGLPADFLISKPGLATFLDKLREARMMPEPKDYKSWRQQMSDLVAAAERGAYEETWALPTGQTYRVTGRPHPDGAVALLFEDISAEISVSRRFRAELETGQSTLDALPQAIAVFTSGGVLSLSNAAYARLWGRDPSTSLQDITFTDALRGWQSACAPSPVWDELHRFIMLTGHRRAWNARISLSDGRTLECQVSPLAHGSTLVAFSEAAATVAAQVQEPPEAGLFANAGAGA